MGDIWSERTLLGLLLVFVLLLRLIRLVALVLAHLVQSFVDGRGRVVIRARCDNFSRRGYLWGKRALSQFTLLLCSFRLILPR